MSAKSLKKFIQHEEYRRVNSFAEVGSLIQFFQNNFICDGGVNKAVSGVIEYDIDTQGRFDQLITKNQNRASFALKSNKNELLFKLAKDKVDSGFDLCDGNVFESNGLIPHRPTSFDDDSANGTSDLNLIQIIFLAALRVSADLNNLEAVSTLIGGAYDVIKSPVVQGVRTPVKFSEFNSWFYYNSNNQELITPNLGYAFGGSRADAKYSNKEFAAQDCSSAVAKFVKAPGTFATYAMKLAYKGDCKQDPLCENVKASLAPKEVVVDQGDVFVKGSHTGFVAEVYNANCFKSLSYNREIPQMEGLGYKDTCCSSNSCMFFGVIESHIDEL
ncbi:MAG: hypothetical protein RLN62_03345 [Rickettsiales bacterium]